MAYMSRLDAEQAEALERAAALANTLETTVAKLHELSDPAQKAELTWLVANVADAASELRGLRNLSQASFR